jgi:predicted O-methyltransferase YrrM
MSETYNSYGRRKEGIEGWFSDMSAGIFDALLVEQSRLVTSGPMLEIGVAHGRSALLMAEHLRPNESLHLSDINPTFLEGAVGRLKGFHPDANLKPIVGPSAEIPTNELHGRTFRFVHIDANHMRSFLLKDMAIADKLLSDTGILVLDDFLAPQYFSATFAAVEYVVRNPGSFRFILVGYNKAYLCRPSAYLYWLTCVRDRLPAHLRACGLEDFTLWKTEFGDDFMGFGIAGRQFDKDFVTWRMYGSAFGAEDRAERGVAEEVDFDSP